MGWKDENGNPVTDPGTIQQLELGQQGQPDLIGRAKQSLLASDPTKKSMFGETTLPGQIVHGIGEAVLPGSWSDLGLQAGISAGAGLLGKALGPWTRGGRVAGVAKGLGREANPNIRLAEARGPIAQAYQIAENVNADVPIGGLKATIRRAISEGPMDERAVDELLKLESSDLVGNAPNGLARYKSLVEAEQRLPTDIYDDVTNATMRNVRQAIVNTTSAVNPALARANALTAHTTASDKVLRIINSSKDANSAAATVDNLLSKEPQTVKALGLNNPVGMEQFRSLIARGAPADTIKAFLQRYGGWILGGAAAGAGGVAVHQMFGGGQSQGGGGG